MTDTRLVLVCGSRRFADEARVWHELGRLRADARAAGQQFEILNGGARGPDSWAAEWAHHNDVRCVTMRADWIREGRRAGILRNLRMLDLRPDIVVAFWTGESRGTGHTIAEARRRGILVEVHR